VGDQEQRPASRDEDEQGLAVLAETAPQARQHEAYPDGRAALAGSLSASTAERAQALDHVVLVRLAEVVVEGQPEQAVAQILGDRAVPGLASQALAHLREVER